MKKLVKTDNGYVLEEASLFEAATEWAYKPIIMQPVTGGQALAFGAATLVIGGAIGATVGRKFFGTVAQRSMALAGRELDLTEYGA